MRGEAAFAGDIERPPDAPRQGAAQPARARPHRPDRHVGGGGDARRRVRPHRRRPARHRTLLRSRDQGPAHRRASTGSASPASRSRRWPPRTRPTAEAALRLIEVEYEELPVVAHDRRGARRRTRRSLHEEPLRAGLFHGLGQLRRAATATSATATASTAASVEGAVRRRRPSSSRASYTFPAVYQYAMETHTRRRPGPRPTGSRSGRRASTRSSCAPRSPTCSACRSSRARHRALPRRRLRLQVVHEDGADHRRRSRARRGGRSAS